MLNVRCNCMSRGSTFSNHRSRMKGEKTFFPRVGMSSWLHKIPAKCQMNRYWISRKSGFTSTFFYPQIIHFNDQCFCYATVLIKRACLANNLAFYGTEYLHLNFNDKLHFIIFSEICSFVWQFKSVRFNPKAPRTQRPKKISTDSLNSWLLTVSLVHFFAIK